MKHVKTSFLYSLIPSVMAFLPDIYGVFARPEDYLLVKGFHINTILVYLPLTYALISFIFGWRKGVSFIFPVVLLLMFISRIIWDYTHNTAGTEVYLVIYGSIILLFMILGWGVRSLLQKNRKNT